MPGRVSHSVVVLCSINDHYPPPPFLCHKPEKGSTEPGKQLVASQKTPGRKTAIDPMNPFSCNNCCDEVDEVICDFKKT